MESTERPSSKETNEENMESSGESNTVDDVVSTVDDKGDKADCSSEEQANITVAYKEEKVEPMETDELPVEEPTANEEFEYGVAEISKSSLMEPESDTEIDATGAQKDSDVSGLDSAASSPISEEVLEAIVEDVKPGTYVTKSGRTVTVRIKLDLPNDKPRGKYECNICCERFMSKAKLETHQDDWHSAYPCPTCGKTFKTSSKLKKHRQEHARDEEVYKMMENDEEEEEAAEDEGGLEVGELVKGNKSKIVELLNCESCHKVFRSKTTLLMHKKRFHGKPLKFQCKECSKSYASEKSLESHIQKVHEQPFKCLECMKSYPTEEQLMLHINTHTGETYKCKQCGREFNHKINLTEHIRRIHGKTFSCMCEFCGKGFINNSELKQHVAMHMSDTPFKCTKCEKSFKRKNSLDVHIATHSTEKAFQCEICGSRFITQMYLKRHKLSHDPARPFECELCGKFLKTKKLLRLHQKVHSDSKPFVCEFCGRGFKYQYNLTPHRRIHTGVRPYKCDLCGREFIQKVCLQKHKCSLDPLYENPEKSQKVPKMNIDPVPGISPVMEQAIALLKQAQELQEQAQELSHKSDDKSSSKVTPESSKSNQARPEKHEQPKSQNVDKSKNVVGQQPCFPERLKMPHHTEGYPSHAKPQSVPKVTKDVIKHENLPQQPNPVIEASKATVYSIPSGQSVMTKKLNENPTSTTREVSQSAVKAVPKMPAFPQVSIKSAALQAGIMEPGRSQASDQDTTKPQVFSQVTVSKASEFSTSQSANSLAPSQVPVPKGSGAFNYQLVTEPSSQQVLQTPISKMSTSQAFQQIISEVNNSQAFTQVTQPVSQFSSSSTLSNVSVTDPVYSHTYVQIAVPEAINSMEIQTTQFPQIAGSENVPHTQYEFLPTGIHPRQQPHHQVAQYAQVGVTESGNIVQHFTPVVSEAANMDQHFEQIQAQVLQVQQEVTITNT